MKKRKELQENRKQNLGIFYTRREIVEFVFQILKIWKAQDDMVNHRWELRKPRAHFPSVIDPACGEGIFLKVAVESGFTGYHPTLKTPYVFGVDLDGEVVKRWEEISILHDLFAGKREKMLDHFHEQNGLVDLPEKVYNYKTGGLKEFDAVVGNPPFGGVGLGDTELTDKLVGDLSRYELLPSKVRDYIIYEKDIFGGAKKSVLLPDAVNRLKSFPIEILFVERFIKLAKEGGWIAIIVPDGVLSNSSSNYVRDYLAKNTEVKAIVSLPRDAFKEAGTNAKTSVLFLKKSKKGTNPSDKVFLASVPKVDRKYFKEVARSYEAFYNFSVEKMKNNSKVKVSRTTTGTEAMMVRVDKTLGELMNEKPSSRWGPDYWHPKYDKDLLTLSHFSIRPLGDFVENCVSGHRGRTEYVTSNGIRNIEAVSILASGTGVNPYLSHLLKKGGHADIPSRRTKIGDLLFARSGVGTSGRSALVSNTSDDMIIGGHILKITLNGLIEPEYVQTYLKTCFGWSMLDRARSGVSALVLDKDDVLAIPIPILESDVRKTICQRFEEVVHLHDKAIELEFDERDQIESSKLLEQSAKKFKGLVDSLEEKIECGPQ